VDETTAKKVGSRHGAPVILKVKTADMVADNFKFYISENGVWLTDHVPVKYINFP
jgi:putative RNA 2'-phosphotransferase